MRRERRETIVSHRRRCRRCGEPLPPRWLPWLCPGCLVEELLGK